MCYMWGLLREQPTSAGSSPIAISEGMYYQYVIGDRCGGWFDPIFDIDAVKCSTNAVRECVLLR